MEYHYVLEMGGQIVAALFVPFDQFYGSSEFGKHFGEIKTGLTTANDHYFLQISILSSFVYFRIELQDRRFFADYIYEVVLVYDLVPMRYDHLAVF